MTSDSGGDGRQPRPANDNRPPNGKDAGRNPDASARVDAVVLTIARLIGRQIAREHFEGLHAANDNKPPKPRGDAPEGRSDNDGDQ